MSYNQRRTCRLCLQKSDLYKVIEKSTSEIFDALLLRVNLEISDEPVMCNKCGGKLKQSFEFKSACLRTQIYFAPFIKQEDDATLPSKESCMNKNETKNTHEHHNVCCMCMNFVKSGFFIAIDSLEEEGIFQRIMLEESLADLKLSAAKNVVICTPCNSSLKKHYNFLTDCLSIERNIKLYCVSEGTNGGKINLNNVQKFMYKGMYCVDDDADYAVEEPGKDQRNHYEEKKIQNDNVVRKTEDNIITISDEDSDPPDSSHIKVLTPQVQVSIKASTSSGTSSILQSQGSLYERPRRGRTSQEGSFEITMHESDKIENKLVTVKCEIIDEDVSETIIYKCKFCTFSTHYESSLTDHMLSHTEKVIIYRCESCSFETKNKNSFHRHALIHKNPTKTSTYACKYCPYKTRYKGNLKNHVKKCGTDVTLYQCKLSLHRTNSETSAGHTSGKITCLCASCIAKKKHTRGLKTSNVLKDKRLPKQITPALGKLYQCTLCSFRSNYKGPLQRHIVSHKVKGAQIENSASGKETTSGGKLYRCTLCSFRSNYKGPLQRHIVSHKVKGAQIKKSASGKETNSGGKSYRCTFCPFRSKYKGPLQNHMVSHKMKRIDSEVKWYKCTVCSYRSNYRGSLRNHILVHKEEVAEIQKSAGEKRTNSEGKS